MSIKLKITWSDDNVVTEGIRIYKSSSIFTKTSLPEVYATIKDGSGFFEDFNVVDGQTYFYMLSCFLGEQEVFTECYEITAISEIPITVKAVLSSSSSSSTGYIMSISVPPYNVGDVILLAVQTNVLDAAGTAIPSGFTLIDSIRITDSTSLRVCYKISTTQTTQNTVVTYTCDSATAIILSSTSPISALVCSSAKTEKANPDTVFPALTATTNASAFFFGLWDSFYSTSPQTVTFTNASKIAGADYSSSSLKHGIATKGVNKDEAVSNVSMQVNRTTTGAYKVGLISVLLTAS